MDRAQVIIPIASLDMVKSRLHNVLSLSERGQLVFAMLEDLSAALFSSECIQGVTIVSPDSRVIEYATSLGFDVVVESSPSGLNKALELATSEMVRIMSESPSLIVPIDLPLLRASTLDGVFAIAATSTRIVVAAQSNDGGTNLLLRYPCDVISTNFGPNSFSKHRNSAVAQGIPFHEWDSRDTRLDIDTLKDILEFLKIGKGTKTWSFLSNHISPTLGNESNEM
jgi:2-phospho-L-lactate guanylyltransferase